MAESLLKELGVEDLYGFLGVSNTASEKEVTKAYRKKALRCHPDKNPDDQTAAEMFQKLSRIYGILTDPAAKSAYDKWLKAREKVKRRNEELSAKRRKLKETLESKENDHYASLAAEHEARELMKSQIERLREMSFEIIQKQEQVLRKNLKIIQEEDDSGDDSDVVIQATWDRGTHNYTTEELHDIFSRYGQLEQILPSKKKNKVLISFQRPHEAVNAVRELSDTFQFKWISGEPPKIVHHKRPSSQRDDEEDYERAVLERLHQAQERKQE